MNQKNPRFNHFNDTFIIAEIGGNHEGNFEYAKKLLLDAARSGADAAKFQTYKGDMIVNKWVDEDRNAHFKKFELSDDQWMALVDLAKTNGIQFMSSVWDQHSLSLLDEHIGIHKIGSGDLTNFPLLKSIAQTNKPLIISTAMATLEEIKNVVAFIDASNPDLILENKLCVMHCVAMYGEPKDEHANLLSISVLQDTFPNIPIGYSDHTLGYSACEMAMAMGASVIEVHFTDDKTRAFRDHQLSIDMDEMTALVSKKSSIKTLLGQYQKQPMEGIETNQRIREFRRAVYPTQDLHEGDQLIESQLTTLRPNEGIGAQRFYEILGRRINKAKKAFEPLYDEDLD